MKNINLTYVTFITGATGSGKTFRAIQEANKIGTFAYFSPTGLLTCDTFSQYAQEGDSLNSLNFKIDGDNNHFGIFSQFEILKNINNYNAVIIDECHWAFEFNNHGFFIREIIEKFKGKIFMVTGTPDFEIPEHAEHIVCVPQKKFKKKKISFEDGIQRLNNKVPTLILAQSHNDTIEASMKIDSSVTKKIISKKNTILEILEAIEDFKTGKITCLIGTNILSQGINLACENIIIWDKNTKLETLDFSYRGKSSSTEISRSSHDGVLNCQRIGRLGRMNITPADAELTYSVAPHQQVCRDTYTENIIVDFPKNIFSFETDLPDQIEASDYKPPKISIEDKNKILKILKIKD